jgi:hypothetical protein
MLLFSTVLALVCKHIHEPLITTVLLCWVVSSKKAGQIDLFSLNPTVLVPGQVSQSMQNEHMTNLPEPPGPALEKDLGPGAACPGKAPLAPPVLASPPPVATLQSGQTQAGKGKDSCCHLETTLELLWVRIMLETRPHWKSSSHLVQPTLLGLQHLEQF